jgi:hypothetical protein
VTVHIVITAKLIANMVFGNPNPNDPLSKLIANMVFGNPNPNDPLSKLIANISVWESQS